jgi:hypothetical protein
LTRSVLHLSRQHRGSCCGMSRPLPRSRLDNLPAVTARRDRRGRHPHVFTTTTGLAARD